MTPAVKYYQSIKADREEWRALMPMVCMDCGIQQRHAPRKFLEIHEILTRASLPGAWYFRANIILLCGPCHFKQQARNKESMTRCLAVKALRDPLHYDLELWLKTRNPKAMQYITQEEIDDASNGLADIYRANSATLG